MKKGSTKQFCSQGHDTFVVGRNKNSGCKECSRIRSRKYSQSPHGKEKQKEYRQSFRAKQARKRWEESPKGKLDRRKGDLKIYNLTVEGYQELFEKQNGCCAICGRHQSLFKKRLSVDHDHRCCPPEKSCGACIRGLLCYSCNLAIGSLQHNVELCFKAIDYLRK